MILTSIDTKMATKNVKIGLKYFVFCKLQNNETLSDQDIYNFRKKEKDVETAQKYIKMFKLYQRDRLFFAGKNITNLHSYRGRYFAMINNAYHKISKQMFEEILPLYKRNMDRPDLKDVFDYDLK